MRGDAWLVFGSFRCVAGVCPVRGQQARRRAEAPRRGGGGTAGGDSASITACASAAFAGSVLIASRVYDIWWRNALAPLEQRFSDCKEMAASRDGTGLGAQGA